MRAVRIAGALAALILAGLPAAPAGAQDPAGEAAPVLLELQPSADGTVPEGGVRPIALVSVGTMLVAAGLTALLVRPPATPAAPPAPRRRRAPGRGRRTSRPRHGADRRSTPGADASP